MAPQINGYDAITTVAIAKVDSDGTNTRVRGCTVTRTDTGRYTCTFTNALPDANYVVHTTVQESASTLDDIICTVQSGATTTTDFDYEITEQDNSTTAGTYRDRPHFVSVFY